MRFDCAEMSVMSGRHHILRFQGTIIDTVFFFCLYYSVSSRFFVSFLDGRRPNAFAGRTELASCARSFVVVS